MSIFFPLANRWEFGYKIKIIDPRLWYDIRLKVAVFNIDIFDVCLNVYSLRNKHEIKRKKGNSVESVCMASEILRV